MNDQDLNQYKQKLVSLTKKTMLMIAIAILAPLVIGLIIGSIILIAVLTPILILLVIIFADLQRRKL